MKPARQRRVMTALNLSSTRLKRNSSKPIACQLQSTGWNQQARRSLERILSRGAGQGLPVVFDFDNTLVSGDVGEAVLAVLAAEGRLSPPNISKTLCPPLQDGGERIEVEHCGDIMEYYEALLTPTVHGKADPTPLANGYVWATQVLETLSVAEVLEATARAFSAGQGDASGQIEVTLGKPAYPAPRFHEEMIELIAELLRLDYHPWIVSASNVWSVRWMVVHALNPLLAKRGIRKTLSPERVIGLATLLSDSKGRLYKDAVLVRQDPAYAALQTRSLNSFFITRHIQFPAPVYSGKVACIHDALGCNPYLCAGDSPSDHPMMSVSQHRLWIARPEKPEAQLTTQALMGRTGKRGWILQGCFKAGKPGFVPSPCPKASK
jgi:hypothetical protein